MARVARPVDRSRILALRTSLDDNEYLMAAVDRLAGRITDKLLGMDDLPMYTDDYRSASDSSRSSASRRDEDE